VLGLCLGEKQSLTVFLCDFDGALRFAGVYVTFRLSENERPWPFLMPISKSQHITMLHGLPVSIKDFSEAWGWSVDFKGIAC